jgi:23S rRNA G2069 N7-methylase RlmK/C1962 C5-methylase RlmI
MATRKFNSANSKLLKHLDKIPEFNNLSPRRKGTVIDRITKAALIALMEKGSFKPEQDYVKELSDIEECADFITVSKEATRHLKVTLKEKRDVNPSYVQLEIPFDDVV